MANRTILTQEQKQIIQELAGTMYDKDVAEQTRCNSDCVKRYRYKNNIPSYKTKMIMNIKDKLCGVAGSISNGEIVNVININPTTVGKYKKDNNICKKDTKSSDGAKQYYCSVKDLHAKLKQYAGTDTDAPIAQMCGCSTTAVFNYRRNHDIPPVKNGSNKRLTKDQKLKLEKLLEDPSYSNDHIASVVGCSAATVKRYRKTLGYPKYISPISIVDFEKMKELAGTMSDIDVAKRCNSVHSTVFDYRKRNNIPAFKPPRARSLDDD